MSQSGVASSPTLSFLRLSPESTAIMYELSDDFDFDAETGVWTAKTSQFGATPSLKFYKKSDGSLITVNIEDNSNYQPGGELFGITPPGQEGTGVQIEVTVVVNKTFNGGYTMATTIVTEKVDATPANTNVDASRDYTADSGTITGDFGTINMSSVQLTASGQGATVSGSYSFTTTVDGQTFTGTASFTEDGCSGATIKDGDGNTLGTAQINDEGKLIFTDAETGETQELTRIET